MITKLILTSNIKFISKQKRLFPIMSWQCN